MEEYLFKKPIGEGGVRNWQGVLKFQRPIGVKLRDYSYELLYYDKDREHEGFFPLGEFPKVKDRKRIFNHIFHGEFKTYWLVRIEDGIWDLVHEVEEPNW